MNKFEYLRYMRRPSKSRTADSSKSVCYWQLNYLQLENIWDIFSPKVAKKLDLSVEVFLWKRKTLSGFVTIARLVTDRKCYVNCLDILLLYT